MPHCQAFGAHLKIDERDLSFSQCTFNYTEESLLHTKITDGIISRIADTWINFTGASHLTNN